jgi:hypothetical protein
LPFSRQVYFIVCDDLRSRALDPALRAQLREVGWPWLLSSACPIQTRARAHFIYSPIALADERFTMPRKSLISFLNLFSFRFMQKESTRRRRSRTRLIGTRPSAIESLEALEDRTLLSVSVTLATTSLSASATEVVINGSGFDPIVSNNSVTFNKSAVGIVTAATATSLTVTFTTEPSSAGNLTAIVTSNSVSSGSAVQVATVVPRSSAIPQAFPLMKRSS